LELVFFEGCNCAAGYTLSDDDTTIVGSSVERVSREVARVEEEPESKDVEVVLVDQMVKSVNVKK
jgi:hypothetical protein